MLNAIIVEKSATVLLVECLPTRHIKRYTNQSHSAHIMY